MPLLFNQCPMDPGHLPVLRHSQSPQRERTNVVQKFKGGSLLLLVSRDWTPSGLGVLLLDS